MSMIRLVAISSGDMILSGWEKKRSLGKRAKS